MRNSVLKNKIVLVENPQLVTITCSELKMLYKTINEYQVLIAKYKLELSEYSKLKYKSKNG